MLNDKKEVVVKFENLDLGDGDKEICIIFKCEEKEIRLYISHEDIFKALKIPTN